MTKLLEAMNETATTENGAVTNYSTLNACLDLFAIIGSSRDKDISKTFLRAYAENPDIAGRILMWARDARGGSGERATVIKLINELYALSPKTAFNAISRLPEVGYWKDVVGFVASDNAELRGAALVTILLGLESKNGLCAKWLPRKGPVANIIRKSLGYTPKEYRALIVGLSNTVEQKMSANQWADINYSHVPSVAASNYSEAFTRHDPTSYGEFVKKATSGEVKVNSAVLYPHTIVTEAMRGNVISDAQWNQLPDYFDGNGESILPVIDVSRSMGNLGYSTKGHISPIQVSVGLGIYCSQRLKGPFKNQWVTFSEQPRMEKLPDGNLKTVVNSVAKNPHWGGSTNISGVFELILQQATKFGLTAADLPNKVLIISDMEFDTCGDGTNFHNIQDKYAAAGYPMPQVVFWNVNSREGNMPVTVNDNGVALVSGFSPAIMKSVLGNISPVEVMMRAVGDDRYSLA